MRPQSSLQLRPGEVHLWYGSIQDIAQAAMGAQVEAVLSEAELAQWREFSFPGPRNEYLASRFLIRNLLTSYLPQIEPKQWVFEYNAYDKPSVKCHIEGLELQFNISHSKDFIVCVFSLQIPVGVDIESKARNVDAIELSRESFSKDEARELSSHTGAQLQQRFWEYWTLKEAFIKAIGMGLSCPLGDFTFRIPRVPNAKIEIAFSDAIPEHPASWQFRLLNLIPGYQVALAVKCGAGQEFALINMGEFVLPSQEKIAA